MSQNYKRGIITDEDGIFIGVCLEDGILVYQDNKCQRKQYKAGFFPRYTFKIAKKEPVEGDKIFLLTPEMIKFHIIAPYSDTFEIEGTAFVDVKGRMPVVNKSLELIGF